MAKLTVVQSAKAGYAARPTIYKDIKGGKISIEKTSKGTTVIEESGLRRVYGNPSPKTPKEKVIGEDLAAAQKEISRLKEALEVSNARAATALNKVEEVRTKTEQERDRLYQIMEDHQKLLEDANKNAKKGLLGKIFGG